MESGIKKNKISCLNSQETGDSRPDRGSAQHRQFVALDEIEVDLGAEARPVLVGAEHRRAQEGVAIDPLVGADCQQTELGLAAELPGEIVVAGRRNALPAEQGRRQVGDLQKLSSVEEMRVMYQEYMIFCQRMRNGAMSRWRPESTSSVSPVM